MKVLLVLIACYLLNLNGLDKFQADLSNMNFIRRLMKCDNVEVLHKNDSETIWAYRAKVANTPEIEVGNTVQAAYDEWKFECRSKITIPVGRIALLSASECYNMPGRMFGAELSDNNALVRVRALGGNGPFLMISKTLQGDTIAAMLDRYSGHSTDREKLVEAYRYLAKNLARLANFGCKENEALKEEFKAENSVLTMADFAFDKVFICGDKAILDELAFDEEDRPVYQNLSKVLLALSFTNVALNNAYMDKAINCDGLFDYDWRAVTIYERVLLAANLLDEYSILRDLSVEERKQINDVLVSDFREKILSTIDDVDVSYGSGTWGKIMRRYDAIEALEVFENAIGKIWKLYKCLMHEKLIIKGDEPNEEYIELFKERILVYDPITGSDRPYLNEKGLFARLKGWAKQTAVARLFKKIFRIRDLYRTRNSEFKDVLDSYIQEFSDAKLP